MNVIEKLKHARRAGVPIIAIGTPDAAATIRLVADKVNSSPMLVWDAQRGVMAVNADGQMAMGTIDPDNASGENPIGLLEEAAKLPERTILFIHNAAKIGEAVGLPWIQGV